MSVLDAEVCRLMKYKAPYSVVISKFQELYGGMSEEQQWPYRAAWDCYLIHYGYHSDVCLLRLNEKSEFNPLLTLLCDGRTSVISKLIDYGIYNTYNNLINYEYESETVQFTDICMPAYGIIQDGIFQMDQKTTALDIIIQQDNAEILFHLLCRIEKLRAACRVLLVHAARYGATKCCKVLGKVTADYKAKPDQIDPMTCLDITVLQITDICNITMENALCTFVSINERYPHLSLTSRLDSSDLDKIAQFNTELYLIEQAVNKPQSLDFTAVKTESQPVDCDLKLFAKVTILSCETLLEAEREQNPEAIVVNSCLIDNLWEILHSMYYSVRPSISEGDRIFVMMLINKLFKLLMQYNALNGSTLYYICDIDPYVQRKRKTYPPVFSIIRSELLRIFMAYGRVSVHRSWDGHPIVASKWVDTCLASHDTVLDAVRLYASLLPHDLCAKCRKNALEDWKEREERYIAGDRTDVVVCHIKENAENGPDPLQLLNDIWTPECPTLQELCRRKVFQITPMGNVPIHAQQLGVHPVKSFLVLDTDVLLYDKAVM